MCVHANEMNACVTVDLCTCEGDSEESALGDRGEFLQL